MKKGDKYLNKQDNGFNIINKFFEVSKSEYDNTFNRRNKLDNKVNILFTAYAFFVLVYVELLKLIIENNIYDIKDLFNRISKLDFCRICNIITVVKEYPSIYLKKLMLLILSILIILITILLLYNLCKLLILLSGIELSSFDPDEILSKNMLSLRNIGCLKYIIANLEICKNNNNMLLNEKYDKYNEVIKTTWILVILLVATFLLNASLYLL